MAEYIVKNTASSKLRDKLDYPVIDTDGHIMETPFVIDDPSFYMGNSGRVEQIVSRKVEYAKRRAQAAAARKQKQTKTRR